MKYQVHRRVPTIYVSVVILSKSAVKPIRQAFQAHRLEFGSYFWNRNIFALPWHLLAGQCSRLYPLYIFFSAHRHCRHTAVWKAQRKVNCCILCKALCNRIHGKSHTALSILPFRIILWFYTLLQSDNPFQRNALPVQLFCLLEFPLKHFREIFQFSLQSRLASIFGICRTQSQSFQPMLNDSYFPAFRRQ